MVYFSKQLGDADTFDRDQYAKLEKLKKDYETSWVIWDLR